MGYVLRAGPVFDRFVNMERMGINGKLYTQ
jgi:hypothetical protein